MLVKKCCKYIIGITTQTHPPNVAYQCARRGEGYFLMPCEISGKCQMTAYGDVWCDLTCSSLHQNIINIVAQWRHLASKSVIYLNRFCLTIKEIPWHSFLGNFTRLQIVNSKPSEKYVLYALGCGQHKFMPPLHEFHIPFWLQSIHCWGISCKFAQGG